MKRLTAVLLLIAMIFAFTACGGNSRTPSQSPPPESTPSQESTSNGNQTDSDGESGGKILIAFFSRADENYNVGFIEKGNTQILAEMISEQTGGTLFHIQTVTPYPEDYEECTDIAQQEKKSNARPELMKNVQNMDDYDVIFLGYPNWWGDMPMAVYTFLESHDFSGKTIVPFNTHEGSGLSGTVQSISDTCPGAKVLDGLSIRGKTAQESQEEAKRTVIDWLRKQGFVK